MSGSLVCVGLGMKLGAHISPISKSHIEQADVVFSLASNGVIEQWVDEMNPNVISLQPYYQEGKSRNITYKEMIDAILQEVKAGKKVVGAFYGHPGVFAFVPHKAIEIAQNEGFNAYMEPGISAEDCLFADLAIDPGKYGYQQYETSQFMFYQRLIDPSAYLVLWQVGVAGDRSLEKHNTGSAHRQILVELLLNTYPADHKVILYQAKVLPTDKIRSDEILLKDIVSADLFMHTTLVIPPSEKMKPNNKILAELERLEEQNNYAPHLKVIK
ncbi:hypothetical protein HII17_16810 [Thalassotalea sp. M1531]|uniref:Tetrapyrrole methylase domain-containing protein n=1 Tax=Thalassotalea algicola TaxID=2716224 RepID=A0A7Y0Q8H0_9GAMM|nr:SAM-dependent methyltransferase [Thalassotalea algicola]NMP33216.1 hypothetical protein [Thalassotalea algicola]